MIKIVNFEKVYYLKNKSFQKALSNVNLELPDKGLVLICGKSGSGKTTLLNILGGLDCQTSGDVIVDGEKLEKKDLDSYRNYYSSFVFQDLNLIEELTVLENLEVSFDLTRRKYDKNLIIETLKKVNLPDTEISMDDFLSRHPKELSGGQKQRVSIARALLKNPSVLILDEPTAALDEENSKHIGEMLKDISKDCLVIVSSHNLDVLSSLADRIIEIEDGDVISDKTINKIEENNEKQFDSKRKGRLGFLNTMKLVFRSLWKKKVRLFVSLVLQIVTLFLFSIYYQCMTPVNEGLLRALYSSGTKTAFLTTDTGVFSPEASKLYLNDVFRRHNVRKWDICDCGYSNFYNYCHDTNVDSCFSYIASNEGAIKVDSNFPYLERYSELKPETECRFPIHKDECAISDISAEILFHSTEYRLDSYDDFHKNDLKSVDDLIGKEYQGKKIVGIFSATNHELDGFLKNHSLLKVDGQDQNLSERDKSFLNGEFLSGYVYVSKDCEEIIDSNISGYVDFLYEIKGDIRDDMSLLEDIKKESLINNPNVVLKTSMSFKVKNKEVKIETIVSYYGLEWMAYLLLFIISVFITWSLLYSAIKDLDHNLGILKSLGCSKMALLNIALILCFVISFIEFIIVLGGMGIFDVCINIFYFYVPLFLIKYDYVLVLLLFTITEGLIPSIIGITKAMTKKPVNVIDSED